MLTPVKLEDCLLAVSISFHEFVRSSIWVGTCTYSPRSTAIQSSQSLPSTTTLPFLLAVKCTPFSCRRIHSAQHQTLAP